MKPLLVLGLLFMVILPACAIDIPDGYVLQILEPTGGKIARPKDWFYSEQHHGPVFEWTISREDLKKGPYQTGLKIQTFVGIKKGTGKTPKEFCLAFLDSKKQTTKVLKTCPESNQGIFTRQCLEVEESITEGKDTQNYHLIYSVFWGNDMDMGVVTIAGAPVALWPQFENTFNVMSAFELIDMKKFEDKKPASAVSDPATSAK